MEKKPINIGEKYFPFSSNLSRYDEQSLETIQKNNNLEIKYDNNYNESSLIFYEDSKNINIPTYDFKNDLNYDSSLFLRDKLLDTKSLPYIDIDKKKKKNEYKNIEVDKNLNDNLIRRLKKIIFNSLLKYDNYIISKAYNNNIGNGINIKKLFKISHFQIKNLNASFNKKLLKTTQGEIFSSDISTRHTSYPLDHNKKLINKLLKEENEEKKILFNQLFSITLSECIHYLKGEIECNILKGLEKFYEKEIIEMDENEEFKEELKKTIIDYEKIINGKKPRKKNKNFVLLRQKSS